MGQEGHEHWFFDHEDPRYLICDCGQYAVRTRNNAGERTYRLIDPPQPVLRGLLVTDLSDCPDRAARADVPAPAPDLREIAV